MPLNNRRVGIAGITVGALLCMLCGIPVVAAMLGIGGISVVALLSDVPSVLKIFIAVSGVVIIAMLVTVLIKRTSKKPIESDH